MSGLLLLVLFAAIWFDVRERRIPNRLVVLGMAVATAMGVVSGGLSGLMTALLGLGAGLLPLLPFFVFRLVGAGDVKLMAVVGAFTGAPALAPITFYVFIAGGLLGLVAVVAARSGSQMLQNLRLVLFAVSARTAGARVPVADLGLKSAARIPYALAIASGVLCWMLIGGWPS